MDTQDNTSAPSIYSAVIKMHSLLTREEKMVWLGIAVFALVVSCLEVVTASIIVIFAQVLNDPAVGRNYLQKLGVVDNLSSGETVLYIAIIVGLVYLFKNIIAAVEVFFQNYSIQKMCYDFKNKLLYRYAQADYGFYLTRNSSYGLHVVGGDAEQAFSSGMVSFAGVISEGVIFIFLVGLIIYLNPILAIFIFSIGTILCFFISKFLLPKFYHWGQSLQNTGIYTSQNLMQFFHGYKEIVLLGKKEAFIDAYRKHSIQRSRMQAILTATNSLPRMGIEILFVGLFVLTVSYLCLGHEGPMQMIGLLSGYLYAGFRLMPGLNRIINQLNILKSIIPSIDRIHREFTTASAIPCYIDIPGFKFQHSIIFKCVNFKYLNSDKSALIDISLVINKGECIGVIGETGSGKSSLIDLLLGLLRPTQGSILIDDKYPVHSNQWHKKIGYVPQAIYLIDDTIEANIAFGDKKINQDRLQKSIDSAQLNTFIDSLPNRVKTVVGERGIRLSGGERQRIAIARALYREPEVLIFDEATSALDTETERRLMETINAVSKERTVIMVAHRTTTLKNCDRIIQLENGFVKAICKYEELSALNETKVQYAKA